MYSSVVTVNDVASAPCWIPTVSPKAWSPRGAAELTVACVVPAPSPGPFESRETVRRETIERLQARELLHELSSRYLREGIRVDTVMPSGRPAETLADLAATPDVDFVVVGRRRQGGFARALIGGIADRLAQISPKPVLVAH